MSRSGKVYSPITAEAFFKSRSTEPTARVRFGKQTFELSGLDKVLFPESQITRLDVMRYYYRVHESLLRYSRDRPLTLNRFPFGIGGRRFIHHDLKYSQSDLTTRELVSKTEGLKRYAFANTLGDLIYLVNIGMIAVHTYPVRVGHLETPDWMIFDLDPQPSATFDSARETALVLIEMLDALKLKSYPKTSGARGIHVYVPIKPVHTFDRVVDLARRIAERVHREIPMITSIERSVKNRPSGAIYLDYLQNVYGKSMAAPYSVREVEGAQVSTPLLWTELKRKISPSDFTIKNAPRRLTAKGDIFAGLLEKRQTLDAALRKIKTL
jgi:bifunctional non-homologous end joining protein LigD